ncbi:ribophorin I [Ancylostoma ceylanicum]|uniref:Dolichyl-diphosphooligosaccharide--protein glycosyltransferase subunit 1 n=1 Tax=Ancylostoma ceylanicum TaxID=53326 RepID=A0A0D6MDB9_9BILA|nr:ribophorin I [Ancylostoma ceylanicum]
MRVFPLVLLVGATLAADWKVVNVERTIDLTSQIVKVTSQLTLLNTGTSEANSVEVLLTSEENDHLSYISAQEGNNKGKLKVFKQPGEKQGFILLQVNTAVQTYKIELLKRVPKDGEVKLKVDYRLIQMLKPLPEKIAQNENQFVLYHGNAHYAAPYPVAQEKTTVKLGSGKTVSVTQVAPTNQENERVVYGPYKDQPAFNKKPIKIHYENNAPFVVATVVERTIEISHWGNIAVEEYIELVHKGAELKTVLPASAKDIYYRDEIGNISTSAVRLRADSVDVDIKPRSLLISCLFSRFPLFGGWRTSYIIGYNVPSFEYLYNKGNEYALKMRVLDHVFDNAVVEKLTTKIILPEMVKKIRLTTPYTMDRRPDEVRATYLDTFGRTVIVLQKENLVPEHIQSFTLFYEFEFSQMIREPLLATAFFFALFTVVIIYVRFDFTIVADPAREARERIQGKVSSLAQLVDKKNRAFSQFLNAVSQYKSSRDVTALQDGKKKLEAERADANGKLTTAIASLKEDSQDAYDKASELCD